MEERHKALAFDQQHDGRAGHAHGGRFLHGPEERDLVDELAFAHGPHLSFEAIPPGLGQNRLAGHEHVQPARGFALAENPFPRFEAQHLRGLGDLFKLLPGQVLERW